jgi:hypothetical protein
MADQTAVGLKGTVDNLKGSVAELEKKFKRLPKKRSIISRASLRMSSPPKIARRM